MAKRLRAALFLISVCALLLGPLIVGALNRLMDAQVQTTIPLLAQPTPTPAEPACVPPVDQAVLDLAAGLAPGRDGDSNVSLRIAALFAADQAARQLPGTDPQKLDSADMERRIEVLEYLQNGETFSSRDLVYAAYIFQHGACPEHYQLANRLAQVPLDAGEPEARWLYAATLDRYLMSLGEPQKFGTQYTWIDGAFQLYPVDPATTDAERAQYDVPPLSEAVSQIPAGTGGGSVRRQWLESWWLTWIGAGFAALSVVLSLVAPQPNSLLGKVALAAALAVYGASAFGHYAQVQALVQGTAEAQQKIWGAANLLALLAWLAFAGFAAFRCRVFKRKAA